MTAAPGAQRLRDVLGKTPIGELGADAEGRLLALGDRLDEVGLVDTGSGRAYLSEPAFRELLGSEVPATFA
jgi:hypothetical protein